jgi:hypothetical protein
MYIYLSIYSYTYILSSIRLAISYTPVDARASKCLHVRAHVRAHIIGGAAAHNGHASSTTDRARPPRAAGAGSGTYPVHVRHGRGVPPADVRVERRIPGKRLRAEPHDAVDANGKCAHGPARIRVRRNTHARTREHTDDR